MAAQEKSCAERMVKSRLLSYTDRVWQRTVTPDEDKRLVGDTADIWIRIRTTVSAQESVLRRLSIEVSRRDCWCARSLWKPVFTFGM